DVPSFELERAVRLYARRGLRHLAGKVERHDLHQTTDADDQRDQRSKQQRALFDDLVFHAGCTCAAVAGFAPSLAVFQKFHAIRNMPASTSTPPSNRTA